MNPCNEGKYEKKDEEQPFTKSRKIQITSYGYVEGEAGIQL